MDRRERLELEMDDRWSPAFEKHVSLFDKVKQTMDKVTAGATGLGAALWAIPKTRPAMNLLLKGFWPLTIALDGASRLAKGFFKGFGTGLKLVGRQLQPLVGMAAGLGKVAIAAGTLYVSLRRAGDALVHMAMNNRVTKMFVGFGKDLLGFQEQLEGLRNKFQTVFGSFAEGNKALASFREFASTTPFLIGQIAESAGTLGAFDIGGGSVDKMQQYLTNIGDAASATGNNIEEMTFAFANATVGQMRGLKRIGITSADIERQMGESIDYATNRGRAKIAEGLGKVMNQRFGQAMQRMMGWTMEGVKSNIQDFIDEVKRSIGMDLGSVVLSSMKKVLSYFNYFKNLDGGKVFETFTKRAGYAFSSIARVIDDLIGRKIAVIGDKINSIVTSDSWLRFWNTVARIVQKIAELYVAEWEERLNSIPAILDKIIPYLEKVPGIVGSAVNFVRDFADRMKSAGMYAFNFVKGLNWEGLLKIWAKYNSLVLQLYRHWSLFKALIKVILGIAAAFIPGIGPFISMMMGLWALPDVGTAWGLNVASGLMNDLAKGGKEFLGTLDKWILGGAKFYNHIAGILNLFRGDDNKINFIDTKNMEAAIDSGEGTLTSAFNKISRGIPKSGASAFQGVFGFDNLNKQIAEFNSNRDAALSAYGGTKNRALAKAIENAEDELLLSQRSTEMLEKQSELYKSIDWDRQRSIGTTRDMSAYYAEQSAQIRDTISATEAEVSAFRNLLRLQRAEGLTHEDKKTMIDYQIKLNGLYKEEYDLRQQQREEEFGILDARMAIFEERAGRYAEEARYHGLQTQALSAQLQIEQQRMVMLRNILSTERMGVKERLKYIGMLEQSRTKAKKLNEELRGPKEDWAVELLGAFRGIDTVAPGAGALRHFQGPSTETKRYAQSTFIIEDRRDLEDVLNNQVLPALDRRIYGDSGVEPVMVGGL